MPTWVILLTVFIAELFASSLLACGSPVNQVKSVTNPPDTVLNSPNASAPANPPSSPATPALEPTYIPYDTCGFEKISEDQSDFECVCHCGCFGVRTAGDPRADLVCRKNGIETFRYPIQRPGENGFGFYTPAIGFIFKSFKKAVTLDNFENKTLLDILQPYSGLEIGGSPSVVGGTGYVLSNSQGVSLHYSRGDIGIQIPNAKIGRTVKSILPDATRIRVLAKQYPYLGELLQTHYAKVEASLTEEQKANNNYKEVFFLNTIIFQQDAQTPANRAALDFQRAHPQPTLPSEEFVDSAEGTDLR